MKFPFRSLTIILFFVICLKPIAGAAIDIVEHPLPRIGTRAPSALALGPDGNVWFTQPGHTALARMAPNGEIHEFLTTDEPSRVTAGPDGNLWFTTVTSPRIGKMTPEGTTTYFPYTGGYGYFDAITAGPDGNLWFVAGCDGQVHRVTTEGNFRSFNFSSGGCASAIVAGPDGNLWFTDHYANKIGRITPAGVVTEFPITDGLVPDYPDDLTVGADGNLWFTSNWAGLTRITPGGVVSSFETPGYHFGWISSGPDGNLWITDNSNRVGRFSTAGALIAEYPLAAGSDPKMIVTGPDERVWFSEYGSHAIGRLSIDGVLDEVSVRTVGGDATAVATGADGNLWVAETNANRIARVSASGDATDFVIPEPNSQPVDITPGSDGAIWFVERAGDRVGRIDSAGVIKEFVIPTAYGTPTGITAGPDGNLWYTLNTADKIGRLTPAGTFTEFPLSSGSTPNQITTGPDGALWFTSTGTNNVGRITTAGEFSSFLIPEGYVGQVGSRGITTGPGGNIWVARNSSLVSLTPQGFASFYSIGGNYDGIATGTDGALWMTDRSQSRIVRAAIANGTPTITRVFPIVASPTDIAVGPNGRIWFAEPEGFVGEVVAPTHATIAAPPTATAGTPLNFTVSVRDSGGQAVASYRGTITLTSDDGSATIDSAYSFIEGDAGVHSFSATLRRAGTALITATDADSGVAGSVAIDVLPAATTKLVLDFPLALGNPPTTGSGMFLRARLTALDAYDNRAVSYSETVHFNSSDTKATLPADYTFVANDAGERYFTLYMRQWGPQTLSVSDTLEHSADATISVLIPRGDANADGNRDVTDVFTMINSLFVGGPPAPGSTDANGDGHFDSSDVFYLINCLFVGSSCGGWV